MGRLILSVRGANWLRQSSPPLSLRMKIHPTHQISHLWQKVWWIGGSIVRFPWKLHKNAIVSPNLWPQIPTLPSTPSHPSSHLSSPLLSTRPIPILIGSPSLVRCRFPSLMHEMEMSFPGRNQDGVGRTVGSADPWMGVIKSLVFQHSPLHPFPPFVVLEGGGEKKRNWCASSNL